MKGKEWWPGIGRWRWINGLDLDGGVVPLAWHQKVEMDQWLGLRWWSGSIGLALEGGDGSMAWTVMVEWLHWPGIRRWRWIWDPSGAITEEDK